jgi:hypothetical protein
MARVKGIPTGRYKSRRAHRPVCRLQTDGDEPETNTAAESHVHDMVVPYFVIESARLGDRSRHVQGGGVNKMWRVGVIKLQTSTKDIHSISFDLRPS